MAKPTKPARGKTSGKQPAAKVPRGKASAKAAPGRAMAESVDEAGLGWIDAGKGYALTLDGGKLAARNDKGKRLSSVPKDLRDGEVADQLEGLRDWLAEHDRECMATVDQWLLRSLPVPRAVLEQVWDDPAWRTPLENAVAGSCFAASIAAAGSASWISRVRRCGSPSIGSRSRTRSCSPSSMPGASS